MAEYPHLPISTDAIIADTQHLSGAQLGAYFSMLMVAWRDRDNSLPNDNSQLARIAKMSRSAWAENREILLAFWFLESGRWRQKRLDATRKKVKDSIKQKVDAAEARWLKNNKTNDADASQPHSPPHMLTKTKTKIDSKPNHSSTTAARGASGLVFDSGNGGKKPIETLLQDSDLQRLTAKAPGWDKYRLMTLYDEFSKTLPPPKDRKAAFFGWVDKFTKNHPPA